MCYLTSATIRSVYECIGCFSNRPRHTWYHTPLRIRRWWHNFCLNRPRCIFTSSLRTAICGWTNPSHYQLIHVNKGTSALFIMSSYLLGSWRTIYHFCRSLTSISILAATRLCKDTELLFHFISVYSHLCLHSLWRYQSLRNVLSQQFVCTHIY